MTEFISTEIPTEFPQGIPHVNETGPSGETSDDPTCLVCGTALSYAGRGRKPKYCDEHKRASGKSSGSGSGRSTAAVETAVQTLHSLYEGLSMPLMLVSPAGAAEWYRQIDGLDERNRTFLATAPDLVKKINATAAKGGSFAFVFSHVIAVAPVVSVVRRDLAERRAIRDAEAAEQAEQEAAHPFGSGVAYV